MSTAFIIHGHDLDPRDELARFLKALDLDVRPFFRAAGGGVTSTVLETVIAGITQSDLVFVLFTPDEQAIAHDPRTGEYRPRSSRGEELSGWQPRPNVIFEAGVAVGVARAKTALVRLGPIRRISDLDGVRYVDLDEPDAKEQLYEFVSACGISVPKLTPDAINNLPGDFARHVRRRWDYHDELSELEQQLRGIALERSRITFLDVLVEYVKQHPNPSDWTSTDVADFFFHNYDKNTKVSDESDGFFWNLLIHGLFAFKAIDTGWDEEELWWANQQEYVFLTARGRALLQKIKATRT